MRKLLLAPGILFACLLVYCPALAQDSLSAYDKLYQFPDKLFRSIDNRSQKLQERISRQTVKYLQKLKRQEKKLYKQLWKKDSVAAKELFGDIDSRYNGLNNKLAETAPSGQLHNVYSGGIDSMRTAMQFMQANVPVTSAPALGQQFQGAFQSYNGLRDKLDQAEYIKKALQERQTYLQSQLQRLGAIKAFTQFKKDVYYYREHINEYKNALEDPSKWEAKLLQVAKKIPAFKNFFGKHSELAMLFGPTSDEGMGSMANLGGLQTRDMVQSNLQQRLGTGVEVSRVVQQNLQSGQSQVNHLKNNLPQLSGSSSDAAAPDFKPNRQKTKSFLKRIEFGTNIQTAKGNSFFPVTSDIGFSVGYKLNDKSSIGIGTSYKLGWGANIRNIRFTHEGVGLRSFLDMQLKGSFYASGGFEYNYQKPFRSLQQLGAYDAWQRSGLIGVSKIISIKSKLFRKTRVQALWDFLSYEQVPRAQPLKFRIGYNF